MAQRGRGGFRVLSSAAVGQRRQQQPIQKNFISGGKLPQPLMSTPIRAPAPSVAPAPAPATLLPSPVPRPIPQAQVHVPTPKQEPAPTPVQAPAPPPALQPLPDEDVTMTSISSEEPKGKPWMKPKGVNKLQKKERNRRRNLRMRKLLQPKTALMVLNEMCGSGNLNISEVLNDFGQSKCTVIVNNSEFQGIGKTKSQAKIAAAEEALKHIVIGKLQQQQQLVQQVKMDNPQNVEEMDTSTPDDDLSWSHIASFAIHKLLTTWDHTPTDMNDVYPAMFDNLKEKNPAKKLPEKAAEMNPIMLLNQMRPNASFEEGVHVGNPPNTQFNVTCKIDDLSFSGAGSTKKVARRIAAFRACMTVLGIHYSPQFLEMNGAASINETG